MRGSFGSCGFRRAGVLGTGPGLALIATVTGLIIGLSEGRWRRRFASGRWTCAVIIGLTSPWALAMYTLGYGGGRLLPIKTAAPSAATVQAEYTRQGWAAAVELYRFLASGQAPPRVFAQGFVADNRVYLDTGFLYSRYYGMRVEYDHTSMVAFGSPMFVAASLLGNAISNSAARTRAANMARPQWRGYTVARTVVTATATWCCVEGRWLQFAHDAVVDYSVNGTSCVMMFNEVEPLQLHGPPAWCHAVLFAYLKFGPQRWQQAARYLEPVRVAAQQDLWPVGVVNTNAESVPRKDGGPLDSIPRQHQISVGSQ